MQHLSQFLTNPAKQHWTAAKRVLQYLKRTINHGIIYRSDARIPAPTAYSDADWGADINDRKSISGYVFIFAGGPIAWSSKKQTTVALSSMEAEYMALTHAAQEATWLRNLFSEIGLTLKGPIEINADNHAAIIHANEIMVLSRSKHIDIRHHFIRSSLQRGDTKLQQCGTKENLADLFTKKLPGASHWANMDKLGLLPELRGSVGVNQTPT